jgi:uncharacterized membrane protein
MKLSAKQALLGLITAILAVLYPLLVYWGLTRWRIRDLALVLLAIAGLRLLFAGAEKRRAAKGLLPLLVALVLICTLVLVLDDPRFFFYYPVLVSAAMLATFAYSLRKPPPMIERFARLREPDLPPEAVAYCRKVTWVWCGFFVLNGAVALGTANRGDARLWALYNGLVSYVLMGLLFAGEFAVRQWLRRRR